MPAIDKSLQQSSQTLEWRNGQPYSTRFEDVYFSISADNPHQGLLETEYVFLKHNQLAERWQHLSETIFTIAETGFGTGLNFLCACRLWLAIAPKSARLLFISTEKYPLTFVQMQQAHANWQDLSAISQAFLSKYTSLPDGVHRFTLFAGRIQLTLHIGDIQTTLPHLKTKVDAWFLDGFAPAKNPDMWQTTLFAHMARLSHHKTTFATFTSAGVVRRALLAHGFVVHKAPGYGKKREMLHGHFVSENTHKKKPRLNNVIIIGGGIAGCATAHAMANRGVNVTLLERHAAVAQEASGNPIGVLYPRLAAHANNGDAMAMSSYLYTLRLLKHLALDHTHFGLCGLLQLAFNTRETARIEGIALRMLDEEIVRYVNKQEASDLAGVLLLHDGLYFPDAGWVNPQAFCRGLLQHPNITIFNHVQISQLSKISEGWQVTSQQGEHWVADAVVIANANDALQLPPSSHLPVSAVRGQMTSVTATAESGMLNTVICTEGYLTPAIEDTHCLGATFDPRDTSLEVRVEDNLSNLQMLTHMSRNLTDLKHQPHAGRAALRCSTPDYLPLAGKLLDAAQLTALPPKHKTPTHALPWHDGLYVNIGHGTKGLTTAPLCAELLASMMLDDPLPIESSLAQAIDPNRFLLKLLGLKRLVNSTV
jgi:tRNA 5-methylaminomethyl-2-thiouridine biosynthesis bifunctional protein